MSQNAFAVAVFIDFSTTQLPLLNYYVRPSTIGSLPGPWSPIFPAQKHAKQGNDLAPAPTGENENIKAGNHVYIITLPVDSSLLIAPFKSNHNDAGEEEPTLDQISFSAAKQAMEQGMGNPFEDAKTTDIPELSPYINHERYENPKENFKHVARTLEQITNPDRAYRYADIACANGEMLYFLKKKFPKWAFHGYDISPEFIECGRAFDGLQGVELKLMDFNNLDDKFDIVSCIGTMHTMWEPEEPLLKLLSLCKEGGVLLVDGCFNPYDVEVRAVFMDNSKPGASGVWQRDFNQHSRTTIGKILEGRCRSFDFEDIIMGVEIPRKPDALHSDVWTFKDEDGRVIITNGTRMILNKTLLTVHV